MLVPLRQTAQAGPETSEKRAGAGGAELSPAQHAAVLALVSGQGYSDVCQAIGIDRRTLYEWRQQPQFQAALAAEQRATRELVHARLLALGEKAMSALEDVLAGDNDTARVSAARTVLDRLTQASGDGDGVAEPEAHPATADSHALSDPQLEQRVRQFIFEEFRTLDDREVIIRIRAVLEATVR